MSNMDRKAFIKEFTRELRENSAAIFVGAGLSLAAGYVDWKGLLKEIAEDLGLDVARESDLIILAQFHVNHRHGRDRINKLLIDHFVENAALTENHRLIAALPITSIWTINYDDLLERGFEAANKRIDVKRRQSDFATSRKNIDATIFKMHGDKTDPVNAVLTKEDYENYHKHRELFTIALKGDLVTKSFLFLGVSLSDPNINFILSRVKQLLEDNARQHFCLIKRPKVGECGDDEYTCTRFSHWLAELRRYKIIPVLIDSYNEVTEILAEINKRSHYRDVFISGSAFEYGTFGKAFFDKLCVALGSALIKKDFNIISGFGFGVGDMVIIGAMQTLLRNDDERLQLWPFPQEMPAGIDPVEFWHMYRTKMIANAGVCIILAGNKNSNGSVVLADGVRKEYEIAKALGKIIIPIGATGYVAHEIWELVRAIPQEYYGVADVTSILQILGDSDASIGKLVDSVVDLLRLLEK